MMMKKTIFSLAIAALFALTTACAQKGFVLKGNIQGLEDGSKVTLSLGATRKDEKPMYTAIVKNGEFTFIGKLEGPRLFALNPEGMRGGASIFLENSNMKVTGNYKQNGRYPDFSNMVVEGSKSHDYFKEWAIDVREKLNKMYEKYHSDNQAVLDSMKGFKRGSEEYNKIAQSEAYKKFSADEMNFFNTVEKTYNKIIADNSSTFWGALFMLNTFGYFTDEQKPLYEAMSDEAKNSFYGKILKKELFPETLMGKTAPAFTEADCTGKKHSLKELLGKYTIVDFWASWCAPCRKEIPNLKNLYEKYHAKGLSIVSISIDKEEDKWKKALEEENLPWINLIDKEGASTLYGVKAIPDMFIIDQNGQVVGVQLRGEGLAAKLKELFGE